MRRILSICWLFWLVLMCPHPAQAGEGAAVAGLEVWRSREPLPLAHASELLRGQTIPPLERISHERVLLSSVAGRWLLVRLPAAAAAEADEPPVLVFENLRRLHVVALQGGRAVDYDMLAPDPDPRFARDHLHVTLGREQLQRGHLWVWVDDDPTRIATTPLALHLRPMAEVNARGLAHTRLVLAASVAQCTLAVMALLLWLSLRTRTLLYYGLYVGSQAAYVFFMSGEGAAIPPFSALAALGSLSWNVPAVTGTLFATLFFNHLMALHLRLPPVDWASRWLAGITAVVAGAGMFLSGTPSVVLLTLANLLLMLLSVGMLVVGGWLALRGTRHAQVFVAGWVVMTGFTVLRTWELASGRLPSDLGYYGFPAAMVLCAVLLVVALAEHALAERRELTEARAQAERDPLTGVRNRRSIEGFVLAALEAAERSERPVSLLYMDLDHFKSINDTHGHGRGDDCLRLFADVAARELREGDALGRLGGEEFLAVLRDADVQAARHIAERIREAVARVQPPGSANGAIRLTVSIGVACVSAPSTSVAHAIEAADQALYRAKAAGRNRVELFA